MFTHGIARASISVSFITLMTWLIVGIPKITGTHTAKIGQIQDYQHYLVLTIALDTLYLNLYDYIAHRAGKYVSQAYTGNSSTHEV